METIFISHKVVYPMTVICSPINEDWVWGDWYNPFAKAERGRNFIPSETYVYNAWFFKTLELEEKKYTLPLN